MARQPRTGGSEQASRPEIRVWDHSDDVWAEQFVFSRRRDARLQLLHGLRSDQRRNADRLDQPDHLPRRPADSQLHHAENPRPDLYSVAGHWLDAVTLHILSPYPAHHLHGTRDPFWRFASRW